MKIRRTISTLLVLGLLVSISCKPSVDDINQYLANGEFDKVYSFLQKELTKGSPEISTVIKDDTPFEVGVYGLLFSDSEYSQEFAKELIPNITSIKRYNEIHKGLWQRIVSTNREVPIGLHSYLLDSYLTNSSTYPEIKDDIAEVIKADSIFVPIIRTKFNREVILNVRQTDVLLQFANLGHIQEVHQILESIQELELQKNELNKLGSDAQVGEDRLRNQLNAVNSKINDKLGTASELFEDVSLSRRYSGYMIALLRQITLNGAFYDLYEVRSYSGETSMLLTRETAFQSQGTFTIRVMDEDKIPMKLNNAFGGFVREVPLMIEVTKQEWEDYQAIRPELDELYSRRRAIQRQIEVAITNSTSTSRSIEGQIEQLDQQIKVNRNALQQWVRDNI